MQVNKWEEFAQSFEEKNNYVVGEKDIGIVKERLSSLEGLGKVLELGCGNGTYTRCLARSASQVIATDLSQDMVSVTRERLANRYNVRVEQADCYALDYASGSFDTVFMANLLHVVPNPKDALRESLRVLKTGGRLIAVSFTLHGMSFIDTLALKYRYVKTYGPKSSSNIVLTPQIAVDIGRAVGFDSVVSALMGDKVKAVYLEAEKSDLSQYLSH